MIRFALSAVCALTLSALPAVTHADPKPRNARPAPVEKVIKAYSGKTDLWSTGCEGGIYLAPNNQARAWCSENPENLGAGDWTVSYDGTLCQNLKWYWPEGGRAGSSAEESLCISHVVDNWGNLWRNWPGDAEWWPITLSSDNMKRGYVFQNEVQQARGQLGF